MMNSQWMMADLVLNRLRLKGLRRKKYREHQNISNYYYFLKCLFSHMKDDFTESQQQTHQSQLIHLLVQHGVTAPNRKEKRGYSPPDLCSRGRWAPNEFLRRRRGRERQGDFRGLWRGENGAVRGLGQV